MTDSIDLTPTLSSRRGSGLPRRCVAPPIPLTLLEGGRGGSLLDAKDGTYRTNMTNKTNRTMRTTRILTLIALLVMAGEAIWLEAPLIMMVVFLLNANTLANETVGLSS